MLNPDAQLGIALLSATTPAAHVEHPDGFIGKIFAIYRYTPSISPRCHTYKREEEAYEDLHVRVLGPHLPYECRVGSEDGVGGNVVPYVVGAEMHHDNVGAGGGEPSGKEVLVGNIGYEVASVA